MILTGDFAELARFERKLRESKAAYDTLPKLLSEQALRLTNASFRGQRDPYGAGWAGNLRGGQILRDKGKLSRSVFRRRGADQFTIGFGAHYAGTHQNGATIRAKNAHRVSFTRKNPRRRNAKGNFGRRKTRWFSAGRSGGQVGGTTHEVNYFRTALVFKIGKRWTSKQSVTIPRRMMVPTRSMGLPHTWTTAFHRTADKVLKRHFK